MESLICSICCQRYSLGQREPFLLVCGHTFCNFCIEKFNKNCPTCRKFFSLQNTKKNVSALKLIVEMELMMAKVDLTKSTHLDQEACSTHKREIDKFCKTCLKLLCSNCSCTHTLEDKNSPGEIIPIQALKSKVQEILQYYRKFEKKKDLLCKVDDLEDLELKEMKIVIEMERNKIKKDFDIKVKEIEEDNQNLIIEMREEASRKIRKIQAQKQRRIMEAEHEACLKSQKIQAEHIIERRELNKKIDQMKVHAEKELLLLKKQLNKLGDLNDPKKIPLEDAILICQGDKNGSSRLEAFITKELKEEEENKSYKRGGDERRGRGGKGGYNGGIIGVSLKKEKYYVERL